MHAVELRAPLPERRDPLTLTPVFPVTTSDLVYIMANLSEQTRAEQAVMGLSDAELMAKLQEFIRNGSHSETLWQDGHPIYALGLIDGFTWFVCTKAAWDLGTAGVRIGRQRMRALRNAEQRPLISLSRSPHPDAPRWFRALGFEERPLRSVDGTRMFVYP